MLENESHACPLCHGLFSESETELFFEDKKRPYYRCNHCALVFVPPAYHLSSESEKAEYDKHENVIDDPGYLKFLSRVIDPLVVRLNQYQCVPSGLDFGCGPGPALAAELNRSGFKCAVYDIYYHNDPEVLNKQYDFVTCTEVVEHFNDPASALKVLFSLVKPGGVLAIMTKLVINKERFSTWHYKNDPTHISFFSQETMAFLSDQFGFSVEFIDNDVIFFSRPT